MWFFLQNSATIQLNFVSVQRVQWWLNCRQRLPRLRNAASHGNHRAVCWEGWNSGYAEVMPLLCPVWAEWVPGTVANWLRVIISFHFKIFMTPTISNLLWVIVQNTNNLEFVCQISNLQTNSRGSPYTQLTNSSSFSLHVKGHGYNLI